MPYNTIAEVASIQGTSIDVVCPCITTYRRSLSEAHPALTFILNNIDGRQPSGAWRASDWTSEPTMGVESTDIIPGFLVEEFLRWIDNDP
jgi:hypothetical protein